MPSGCCAAHCCATPPTRALSAYSCLSSLRRPTPRSPLTCRDIQPALFGRMYALPKPVEPNQLPKRKTILRASQPDALRINCVCVCAWGRGNPTNTNHAPHLYTSPVPRCLKIALPFAHPHSHKNASLHVQTHDCQTTDQHTKAVSETLRARPEAAAGLQACPATRALVARMPGPLDKVARPPAELASLEQPFGRGGRRRHGKPHTHTQTACLRERLCCWPKYRWMFHGHNLSRNSTRGCPTNS